ncbi:MobC family plasmid mobilization relaxosome protein [Shewanella sp. SM95]|uniref:MobC family plasmid mobilization relaxosome protein n=1 Tax=Shewanella sp. SM95 TaxID=2912812 RepID=UPI003985CC05
MNKKRQREIKIRCTDEEYQALHQRCTKLRLAEWMRETCLGTPAKRPPPAPTVAPELLRQLAGMGNNLNQIARVVNANSGTVDRAAIMGALVSIERQLAAIRAEHSA